MAITGISAISGEQIIAAGAVSAKEAGKASFTTGGNDIQNLYDTVSTNSASWAEGADYTAGNNISIAGNVISTTNNLKVDSITASGDVMVGNSGISTYVTAAGSNTSGSLWFNTQASLSDTYHIVFGMLNETAVEFGIRDENDWGENYWVSNLSTANLRNDFTITGLSSVPGAVTASAGSWTSLEDLISHGKIGVNTTQTSHYDCTLWKITGNLSASMSALNATVATNSAKWNTVTSKLDSTAFSTVSGDFLTAHQSLPNSGNWDSTYTTVSTNSASWGAGSTYTGDAQGALDEVYSNSANWDGSYDTLTANSGSWTSTNNTVSQRSGNWNKAYTAVTGNSAAWGGSALPISAGPGVKMDVVNDTLVFSNDETVLYSGTAQTSAITFSESLTAFERILVAAGQVSVGNWGYTYLTNGGSNTYYAGFIRFIGGNNPVQIGGCILNVNSQHTSGNLNPCGRHWFPTTTAAGGGDTNQFYFTKVIGINRTASN